jgi:hypothetical protein
MCLVLLLPDLKEVIFLCVITDRLPVVNHMTYTRLRLALCRINNGFPCTFP